MASRHCPLPADPPRLCPPGTGQEGHWRPASSGSPHLTSGTPVTVHKLSSAEILLPPSQRYKLRIRGEILVQSWDSDQVWLPSVGLRVRSAALKLETGGERVCGCCEWRPCVPTLHGAPGSGSLRSRACEKPGPALRPAELNSCLQGSGERI